MAQSTRRLGALLAALASLLLAGPASAQVVDDPCPPEAEGARCGHVDVPFDRVHPSVARIGIGFELYRHTGSGPAASTILVDTGFGNMGSTTASRATVLSVLAGLRARHDLLLVDPRGRGSSAAIECAALQHGTKPVREAAIDCAAQLGDATQRYGIGDIALDFEALRAALGLEKLDWYGVSYGAADLTAYASRFPERLGTVVLDAPFAGPHQRLQMFERTASRVQFSIGRIPTVCERSPACSQLQPRARKRIEALIRRVGQRPVNGSARDADGAVHHVSVDPAFLLVHMLESDVAPFFTTGELAAATEALERGDSAPLLRLAAENDTPIPFDSGPATGFSWGAFVATFCTENRYPWAPEASLDQRVAQWDAAVRAASDAPFAPFRAADVLRSNLPEQDLCLPWPGPTSTIPMLEPGAELPRLPMLVLAGDLDTVATPELGRLTAEDFRGSRFVEIAGAGHGTAYDSPCAAALLTEFFATRRVKDASCADESPVAYPAVGRFPRVAAESEPAAGRGRRRDRQIVRVAVDAALDALKRSQAGGGAGPGLRGGSFTTELPDGAAVVTLRRVRFASDVAVAGTVRRGDDAALEAVLTIDGPGGRDGTLRVRGRWLAPGRPAPLSYRGSIGHRYVEGTSPAG